MKWLDANIDVRTYEYETLRIAYWMVETNQITQKRYYIPDFLVTFADGHKELWELKPAKLCDNPKTVAKRKSATVYCEQNGIQDYRLLTKEDLKAKGIL